VKKYTHVENYFILLRGSEKKHISNIFFLQCGTALTARHDLISAEESMDGRAETDNPEPIPHAPTLIHRQAAGLLMLYSN